MPSPPVWVLEAMIAGNAGAFVEQVPDGLLGRLALDEIADQGDRLARDLRGRVRRRGDAGYQVLHLTLLGRAEKARGVRFVSPLAASESSASQHSNSVASMGNGQIRRLGPRAIWPTIGLRRRIIDLAMICSHI